MWFTIGLAEEYTKELVYRKDVGEDNEPCDITMMFYISRVQPTDNSNEWKHVGEMQERILYVERSVTYDGVESPPVKIVQK